MTAYSRAYTNSKPTKGEGKIKTVESQIMKGRGSNESNESNVQRIYGLCWIPARK